MKVYKKKINFFSVDLNRFILVGITTVEVDYLFYLFLINLNLISINFCKAIGFVMGTVYAYFLNKFFTFRSQVSYTKSIFKFIGLYLFSLLVNVFINELLLGIFNKFALQFSFIIATIFSATLNFLGMKYFVFKKK